jgi:hypothetical protein
MSFNKFPKILDCGLYITQSITLMNRGEKVVIRNIWAGGPGAIAVMGRMT